MRVTFVRSFPRCTPLLGTPRLSALRLLVSTETSIPSVVRRPTVKMKRKSIEKESSPTPTAVAVKREESQCETVERGIDSPKRSRAEPVWHRLQLRTPDELRLELSLPSGQSFRWSKCTVAGREAWAGVIQRTAFFLHQVPEDPSVILFRYLSPDDEATEADTEKMTKVLEDYFQLNLSMDEAWNRWTGTQTKSSKIMQHFKDACLRFRGLRTLRIDPIECLFSFICSQNNNIARITQMVNSLCTRYGEKIGEETVYIGQERMNKVFYAFPTLETIAEIPERVLRDMSFGYRAKFIPVAAKQVLEMESEDLGNGREWLYALRNKEVSRERAQKELTALMGVGKKVADCVCLLSLDKLDAVPVDTHVRQIAQRFMPSLKRKTNTTMNDALYAEISSFFKDNFGADCGWAHSLLFAAELTMFKLKPEPKSSRKKEVEEKEEEGEVKEEVSESSTESTIEINTRGKRKIETEEVETKQVRTRATRRRSAPSRHRSVLENIENDQGATLPLSSRRKRMSSGV